MTAKEKLLAENTKLLEKCNTETIEKIFKLNTIFVGLSAAQMEYIIELSNLLFGQPPK